MSVLALSRAILEYAIINNLHKFNVEPSWPPGRDGKRKDKKVSHLIDELADKLPKLKESMHLIRDYGNNYMHPKQSKMSKQALAQAPIFAKQAVSTLVVVVEGLYLAEKDPEI